MAAKGLLSRREGHLPAAASVGQQQVIVERLLMVNPKRSRRSVVGASAARGVSASNQRLCTDLFREIW